ncbi:uncharacterized protein LOC127705082 [Mytilus californianus]|uniref:uncharacterized protein LOC127705082 n=1 Tax=Mytilus californianus TaxID=6549 RepID=UPI0022481427|nr:uncharacterized protein LOC127705082 [Mytilus californianus]
MHLQIILVFAITFVLDYSADAQSEKCLLPSERAAKFSKKPKSTAFPQTDFDNFMKKLRFRRGRLRSLNNKIEKAWKLADRYCRKPTFTSTFAGFKIKDFEKTILCPGSWTKAQFPENFIAENGMACWTLKNFLKIPNCPTYNCGSGKCALGEDYPDPKAVPVVKYICQLSNFVDIPFYAVCKSGTKIDVVKEVLTVSRCCGCSQLTCKHTT